ncbi:hypothetical protein [Deinococcus soli (ex Cha et al. 2016)]|uniref:Uncharacterized protein n=2 Tax=Deinococcus soli (ex Cha et al. 2016) TaxID=1309411 RepID=A0AAE3XD09_9DEIO|nr:hypothetical protein [Deinococcus soli (ex Cha et al. 2016)]MDR6218409.1 hypothetical protein [Deinococcus soli (ex Cha et al. 2016)]MDR6329149.1 hypothetical protein [Deinococcus soli (ex Cha et al. 2016)]MDR6751422.1 hypothetical protein [Deinococcus soli (ex Cha et al. 2016)]
MRKELMKALIVPAFTLPAGLYFKPNPAGAGVLAELDGEHVGHFQLIGGNAFGEGTIAFAGAVHDAALGTTVLSDEGLRLDLYSPGQAAVAQYFAKLLSDVPDYAALAQALGEAGRAHFQQLSTSPTEVRFTALEPQDVSDEYARPTTVLLAGWYTLRGVLVRFEVRREEQQRKLKLFVAADGFGVKRPDMKGALFIGLLSAVPGAEVQMNQDAMLNLISSRLRCEKAS